MWRLTRDPPTKLGTAAPLAQGKSNSLLSSGSGVRILGGAPKNATPKTEAECSPPARLRQTLTLQQSQPQSQSASDQPLQSHAWTTRTSAAIATTSSWSGSQP